MIKVPSREETIDLMSRLIAGEIGPIESAQWAERLDHPENQAVSDDLTKRDPALRTLIDNISLAAAIDEKGEFLYETSDFQDWLDEFLEQIKTGN